MRGPGPRARDARLPRSAIAWLFGIVVLGLLRWIPHGARRGLVIHDRPAFTLPTRAEARERQPASRPVARAPPSPPAVAPVPAARSSRSRSSASARPSRATKPHRAAPAPAEAEGHATEPVPSDSAFDGFELSAPDAANTANTASDAAPGTAPGSEPELERSESEWRRCCAAAWAQRWQDDRTEMCTQHAGGGGGGGDDDDADDGGGGDDNDVGGGGGGEGRSSFSCVDADVDDDELKASSRRSSPRRAWYCDARHLWINTSAIDLGSANVAVPTPSQKGLWRRRALLLTGCQLRRDELERPRRFGMLMRQLVPSTRRSLSALWRRPWPRGSRPRRSSH